MLCYGALYPNIPSMCLVRFVGMCQTKKLVTISRLLWGNKLVIFASSHA